MSTIFKKIIHIVIIALFISSCSTTAKQQSQSLNQIPASLLGNFTDDYGIPYHLTAKEWVQSGTTKYHLLVYNKQGNYFIAKNDSANPSDGNLFTRIDIMYFENMQPWQWGYCFTVYKALTMQDAVNTAAADRASPMKGCNGYPFSRMKRKL